MPDSCRRGHETLKSLRFCWIGVLLVSCGAFGERAPVVEQDLSCPTVDQQIPTVMALIEEGRLAGLRQVIEEHVSDSLRGQVVELALDIVRALPPGTLDGLRVVARNEAVWALLPLVADVGRFVTDGGRWEVVPVAADLIVLCPSGELLPVLGDLLRDPMMPDALSLMLSDPQGLEALLASLGVDLADPAAREALLALVDNVLASFAAPGFRLDELEELLVELANLGLIDLKTPAIRGLLVLAHEAMDAPGRLETLQGFVGCLRTVDPSLTLVALIYDLVAEGAIALDDLSAVLAVADPAAGGDAVLGLLVDVLDFLATDDEARGSLADVLLTILEPDVAKVALPDLVVLLDAGAVPEVVDLLVSLVYGCHGGDVKLGVSP